MRRCRSSTTWPGCTSPSATPTTWRPGAGSTCCSPPIRSRSPCPRPTADRKSTRLNSSHTVIYTLSLHDALPIWLYLAVGNANHMAPWGGVDLLLSTNPIAVAVPATDGPIVLDMATSVAAYGKVKTAAQRGESMPEGWMVDHQGKPLTDPKRAA